MIRDKDGPSHTKTHRKLEFVCEKAHIERQSLFVLETYGQDSDKTQTGHDKTSKRHRHEIEDKLEKGKGKDKIKDSLNLIESYLIVSYLSYPILSCLVLSCRGIGKT
jgi:hypothetical protein